MIFDHLIINLNNKSGSLDRKSLDDIEKHILNYKNGDKKIADFFISMVDT